MRRRLVVGPLLKSAPIAAALLASPAANALSVKAVFAAENALYGAGYTIGQADGWIDDNLRKAVRQYQADHAGLTSTGELDAKTLEALGISAKSSQVVGGNAVASRSAALSELGLSEERYQQSWASVREEPKTEPKPQTEAEVVSAPEPEIEKEPEPASQPVEIVASAEQTAQPEPEAVPAEPVDEKTQAPEPAQSEPEVAAVEASSAPDEQTEGNSEAEPDSEPVQITSSFGFSANNEAGVAEKGVEATMTEREVDATMATNSSDVAEVLPQEPTAAGVPSDGNSAATSEKAESSGNVLTRVFDFLFGWMV